MVAAAPLTTSLDPNDPIVKYMQKVKEEHAKNQEKDYSHVFRPKSNFGLVRLSCIVVGIELAYAAETAFVSPILLQIGIEHKHMTMVWGLSPLLGFFIAPILGSLSDRCKLSLGRRRPIMILLSFGIACGLLLVPYGRDIGMLLGDIDGSATGGATQNVSYVPSDGGDLVHRTSNIASNFKFSVVFTILGTILLDFDADTSQTPCRTYLLDVCVPGDHAKAMSIYTIMAGLGGFAGYALGAIDWENTQIGYFFGSNIKAVFGIVTISFVICFLITITSFREIPLKLMEKDELLRPISVAAVKKEKAKNNNTIYYVRETTLIELKMSDMEIENEKADKIKPPTPRLSNGTPKDAISLSISNDDDENDQITLTQYLKSIVIMPKSMRILSLTNLFCWMSHVCYSLYFTDFVGEAVFQGDPQAPFGSVAYKNYEEGVRFGCWGLAIYALSCSVYSSMIEKLIKWLSLKICYIFGILTFAIGMLILGAWPTKIGVLVLSITSGVIYATIFTMPFILVAKYHAQDCFKVKSGENVPLKQSRGLGTDIAIISSMVFIAQFIVSLSVGPLITILNSTSAVLYAACAFGLCAAISAWKVLYI